METIDFDSSPVITLKKDHHGIFSEKYRPTNLKEFIGNLELKEKINEYIEKNDIPHLLFYGPPGSGKTSASKLIANSIRCDSLYINASDENGIDDVRNKIKSFAENSGFEDLKLVILDEAHGVSRQGQLALLNLIESNSAHTRFILTCNYLEKLIEPLRSRCQTFRVVPPSKKDVAIHLRNILVSEKIKFTYEDIAKIVNLHFPDIRQTIDYAKRSFKNGELVIDKSTKTSDGDFNEKLLLLLKSKSPSAFGDIRQLIADAEIQRFEEFYKFIYENIKNLTSTKQGELSVFVADAVYQNEFVILKEITFMACIHKILDELSRK